MKNTLKRSLVLSLFITLGSMVAPLGAAEPVEPTAAPDTAAVETESAPAVVEATSATGETNAEILAEAREAKARTQRAQQAKNRRDWLKFAFGRNENTGFDKEYFLGPATRTEFIENSRKWWSFAFGAE